MRRILLLMVVVLSGVSDAARGQSTCAQTLRLAQSIYEQGRLHELPQLLEGCIANGFNDEEKVNAYKLLTLTYIYLEEPAKADEMMLALLRTDTEFRINDAVDPAEFVALYKTFRTNPIYRIGGKLGATASKPSVVSADYVDDGTNTVSNSYGFTGNIAAEIPLGGKLRKFTLNPELSFQLLSFRNVADKGDSASVRSATERQAWISLPISLQYNLYQNELGNTQYFVSGGFSADYLLNPSKPIVANIEYNSGVDQNTYPIAEQRKRFNAAAMLSGGFKRKIGKGFLIVELRYKLGLLPLSDKSDTYENPILVFDYHYVDGVYKMNTFSLSAGYVINRYKPKKLTSR